jgi:hypothetical protein
VIFRFKKSKPVDPVIETEYKIFFKPGAIQDIMKVKGYRSITELSKALGISKSYISHLDHRRRSVSSEVIVLFAALTGSTDPDSIWQAPFEIVKTGHRPPSNNPANNYKKFYGEQEYIDFSPNKRPENPPRQA